MEGGYKTLMCGAGRLPIIHIIHNMVCFHYRYYTLNCGVLGDDAFVKGVFNLNLILDM